MLTESIEETDERLMAKYQQGDSSALEALVRRHATPLLGYLTRLTSNRAAAEDLFQETFLRVHVKASSFRLDGKFKSWLFAIASHLAMDHLRKKPLLHNDDELEQQVDPAPNATQSLSQEERKKQVQSALQQLPDRQRTALTLAYFEELPYAEVAGVMGCSVGSVKTHVSRALHTLARLLPNPSGDFT